MQSDSGEVTRLLFELRDGHRQAEKPLFSLVYPELRQIAAAYLRKESPDHTLQPTALVNEAYLRLTKSKELDWQGRSHFFAVSAKIMRNILVDHARARLANRHGGGMWVVSLDDAVLRTSERPQEVLELNEALTRLCELDERQGQIVEMKFFAGMTEEEIGQVLGVSARTVKRDWRIARAWLFKELKCS